MSTVNSAIAGADPSGSSAPPFFVSTGTTAATIAVNSAVTVSNTSPPYTAAEATAAASLGGGTADQSYDAFVSQVGGDVQSAQNAQQTAQSVLTAVSNQRQSVDGVSLDEEMTNLITYQQAYQASARVMNAIDATLNTLITQVGAASDDRPHHQPDDGADDAGQRSPRSMDQVETHPAGALVGQEDQPALRRSVRHEPDAGDATAS